MSAFIGTLAQATPPAEPGGVSDKAHLFLAAVVLAALVFTVAGVRRHFLSMPWEGPDTEGQSQRFFIWGATAAMLRNLYRLLTA